MQWSYSTTSTRLPADFHQGMPSSIFVRSEKDTTLVIAAKPIKPLLILVMFTKIGHIRGIIVTTVFSSFSFFFYLKIQISNANSIEVHTNLYPFFKSLSGPSSATLNTIPCIYTRPCNLGSIFWAIKAKCWATFWNRVKCRGVNFSVSWFNNIDQQWSRAQESTVARTITNKIEACRLEIIFVDNKC